MSERIRKRVTKEKKDNRVKVGKNSKENKERKTGKGMKKDQIMKEKFKREWRMNGKGWRTENDMNKKNRRIERINIEKRIEGKFLKKWSYQVRMWEMKKWNEIARRKKTYVTHNRN